MAIIAIFAFSFAQASLLSLARMPRPGDILFFVAVGLILLLAIVVSVMIILEAHDEWLFRMVGVIGIADGCLSLVVPIMYKLNTRDNTVTCPECGHRFER